MPLTLTRQQYAEIYGPTTGDQVRDLRVRLWAEHLRTELTEQLSYVREWGGTLVFPIPSLEVV